jgi:hypothetical protein
MTSCKRCLRSTLFAALALLGLSVWPATAKAAKLAFRNDGPSPVVIHGTTLIRGVVVRGKPLLINPGQSASWDAMPAGNAIITVLDAKAPTKTLFTGTLTVGTDDLYYSVQPEPGTSKAKLEAIMKP